MGAHPMLVVLLYAHEVVDTVPREPHDHLVDAAVTPGAVHRFHHLGGAATA
jgi:5-formyltetrahydrofolate cyclo-ligase